MTARPRVLYLAFYFPPSRASGVYRARATANYFAESGWDVTVMRAPQRFLLDVVGSTDEGLAATVDPRIDVVLPEMDYYAWELDIRAYGSFRGNFPFLAKRWHEFKQRFSFPDPYASWGRSAVAEGLRLHAERPFDLVIATGNPFAAFGAAYELGRRTGLPYIVDNRDAWTLDLFTNTDAFPKGHPAWKWERRILEHAAEALYVNGALRDWHAERYPGVAERMHVLLNGWDPDVLPEVPPPSTDEDRPLSFAYVGTLTAVQPVEALFAGFDLMNSESSHTGSTLDLYGHIGFFSGSETRIRSQFGFDTEPEGVRFRGPVSKAEIGKAYADSDVLVFLAGGSKYVTSGKIFEYMATGRPIVSVHERGSAAEELLRDYPLWFVPASLEAADVAAAFAEAGDAARKGDPDLADQARRYAASFTRYQALEAFEQRARALATRSAR
ncbi:glycosyltransferase [Glycomyces sp. NPDC046736]|uniref:glycosyltransferase n=1 Tax=Glycomyces sp. NPDC046736 TaxID=3155615 RepID=UPI0033FBFDD5